MFVLICHVYCSMSQMMMMMAMMMRAGRQHYSLTTTTDWYLWHCHTLPGQPVVAMVLARAGAGGQAAMAPAARLQLQPLVVLVKLCHSAFTSHTTSGRTVFSLVHRSIYWAFLQLLSFLLCHCDKILLPRLGFIFKFVRKLSEFSCPK